MLVTHGTHDNTSSNDSNLNTKLLHKSNSTLEEAENESDSGDNREEAK